MSRLANSQMFNIPAPTMGVDWSVPASQVKYPYSPCSLDWIANGLEVKIRDLHKQLANTSLGNGAAGVTGLASHDATNKIVFTVNIGANEGVYSYDPVSETRTLIHPFGASFECSVNYQNNLYLTTSYGAAYFNGTSYVTGGFSGAAGPADLVSCCIYRDRYIQVQKRVLYFAPSAGATSGPLLSFNLESYGTSGEFSGCAPITVTDSSNLADYLVIVSTGGDVLAFTGDFPGSANWQLVVKTRVAANTSLSNVYLRPYAGDAWLIVSKPASFVSVRDLIQKGKIEAERTSLLAKQISFIREATNGEITNVIAFPAKNALLIQCKFDTEFKLKLFGIPSFSQLSNWLYVDLDSGAVSPFTYPLNSKPYSYGVFGFPGFYPSDTTITHSDGYVYSIDATYPGDSSIYRLFNNVTTNTQEAADTFLQFPYSDLESPNIIKRIKMAYPRMSRNNGYVDAKFTIDYDFDRSNTQTFESAAGSSYSGVETKRFIIPITGQGANISVALINERRPRLSCEDLGIQFEQGGPY